jgi:hypothetical protein
MHGCFDKYENKGRFLCVFYNVYCIPSWTIVDHNRIALLSLEQKRPKLRNFRTIGKP